MPRAELPDERLQEAVRLLLKGRDLAGTSLKEAGRPVRPGPRAPRPPRSFMLSS